VKKVALVTGSRRPLGQAIAAALEAAGFRTVRQGRGDTLTEPLARLDVLVTAAPLAGGWEGVRHRGNGDDSPEARVARALDGPYQAVRWAAPLLQESHGAVVNVLNCPPDPETARGLGALTQALSRAMAPRVRVNAVVTALQGAEVPDPAPAAVGGGPDPVGSFALPPDEVVRTILFLLGSPFVNGETLVIQGC
jgi:NAD(P)-dependent dehydrogenase (short-subunit alcohol dehydrogenase family)